MCICGLIPHNFLCTSPFHTLQERNASVYREAAQVLHIIYIAPTLIIVILHLNHLVVASHFTSLVVVSPKEMVSFTAD